MFVELFDDIRQRKFRLSNKHRTPILKGALNCFVYICPFTGCIFSGNLSHNADSWSIAVASEEVLPYATQCFQFE